MPVVSATSASGNRAALYLRISTDLGKPDADNQRLQLRRFCEAQGWEGVIEYEDHETSSRPDRAEFRQMMPSASTREWDLLVFGSMDRFTREGTLATLKYLFLLYGQLYRQTLLVPPRARLDDFRIH